METNEGTSMIAIDTATRAGRMMAAGRVTVTFRSPTGQHITLTAKARKKDGERWAGCPAAEAMVIFIEVPGASGEWSDKVGKVTRSKGFTPDPRADNARTWCAKQLLRFIAGQPLPTGLEAFEEDRCGRCGRALTDPVSIERGIGPECYGMTTGSTHQAKDKDWAGTLGPTVAALAETSDFDRDMEQAETDGLAASIELDAELNQTRRPLLHAGMSSVDRATDSHGVAVGIGDWRARKSYLHAELKRERKTKEQKPCSQGAIFAGTGDDIPY